MSNDDYMREEEYYPDHPSDHDMHENDLYAWEDDFTTTTILYDEPQQPTEQKGTG